MRQTSAAVVGLMVAVAWAQDTVDPPGANIALGASYTLDPAPNYGLSTDAGDGVQLTDGVHLETQESLWGQLSTVGWQDKSPVIVTLDLGTVQPIRGVSFHTAAGRAGVSWPQAIRILIAGEDGQFHKIGDLVELSAEQHGSPSLTEYGVHRFVTDQLRTHGRYVGLVVWNEPFTFVDEIEVYVGEPEWLDEPLPGPAFAALRAYVSRIDIEDPSENIAYGASYTLDPGPNYGLSTDAADYEQLTDGVELDTQESLWGKLSTVGWQEKSPVIVTLDLGTVQPIRGPSRTRSGQTGASRCGTYRPMASSPPAPETAIKSYQAPTTRPRRPPRPIDKRALTACPGVNSWRACSPSTLRNAPTAVGACGLSRR